MIIAIIQSILVYSFLAFILIDSAKRANKTNNNRYMIIGLLIYSVVFGLRYCVGIDYMAYEHIFDSVQLGYDYNIELGLVLINKLCILLGLGLPFSFGICAFLQVFFIFFLFKSHKEIYPFLAFTFMVGGEWLLYANAIRQVIAFSLFVYSLKFIREKKPIMHYLFIALAFLFHRSIALMVVIYPLFRIVSQPFKKRSVQYALLVISLILMNLNIVQSFVSSFDSLITWLGYEHYINDERMEMDVSLGLGWLITLVIIILIIHNSERLRDYYKDSNIPISILLGLFIIGFVFKYSFIGSMMIQRANIYFFGVRFILSALLLNYLFKTKQQARYYVVGLYLLLGFAVMWRMNDNSALFIFNFQDNLFYLKDKWRLEIFNY